MLNSRSFLLDKAFDATIGALAAALTMLVWSYLWMTFSWGAVAAGLLAFLAACTFIEFVRYELRKRFITCEGRESFIGHWRCDRSGCWVREGQNPRLVEYILTLNADGTVHQDHWPGEIGEWKYSAGAARIHTTDGWRQVLRHTPEGVIKFAYDERKKKLADSQPSNFSLAEKVTGNPV